MRVVCGLCRKYIGEEEPLSVGNTVYIVCPACLGEERQMKAALETQGKGDEPG